MKNKIWLAPLLLIIFLGSAISAQAWVDLTECGPVTEDSRIVNDITHDGSTDKCFEILTSGITLDCQGHTITGSYEDTAIWVNTGVTDVIIESTGGSKCLIKRFNNGVYTDEDRTTIKQIKANDNTNGINIKSDYNTIEDINLTISMNKGIYLDSANYNIFDNIDIQGNPTGIYIYQSSDNDFTNIYAKDNNDRSIYIRTNSNRNTISESRFAANSHVDYNIQIASDCSDNEIYNNIFEMTKVDDQSSANTWYDDVNEIGNYWHEYDGLDDGSGTGKHSIAGDDIGDTKIPYPESQDLDNYPLMSDCTSRCSGDSTCSDDAIRECITYANGCNYPTKEGIACPNGCANEDYCAPIVDDAFYRSSGGKKDGSGSYGSESALVIYDNLEGFESPIYVSYKHLTDSWISYLDTGIFTSIFENEEYNEVDANDIERGPMTGLDEERRYDKSVYAQYDFKITESADKIKFDFLNGNNKVIMTDVVVWGSNSHSDVTDECNPITKDYPYCHEDMLGNISFNCIMQTNGDDNGTYQRTAKECKFGCGTYEPNICDSPPEEVDQSYGYDDWSAYQPVKNKYRYDKTYRDQEIAQSFKPTKSHLNRIGLWLIPGYGSGITPTLTVEIQTDAGGKPSGNLVADDAYEEVAFNEITRNYWQDFYIKAELDTSQTYWIVIKDNHNKHHWINTAWKRNQFKDRGMVSSYDGGEAAYKRNGEWYVLSKYDRFFETYGYDDPDSRGGSNTRGCDSSTCGEPTPEIVIDQEYFEEDDIEKHPNKFSESTYKDRMVAQSFIPEESKLAKVTLSLTAKANQFYNLPKVYVEIREDDNGKPSDQVVAKSKEKFMDRWWSQEEIDFEIDADLTAGKTYWIVLDDTTRTSDYRKKYVIWNHNEEQIISHTEEVPYTDYIRTRKTIKYRIWGRDYRYTYYIDTPIIKYETKTTYSYEFNSEYDLGQSASFNSVWSLNNHDRFFRTYTVEEPSRF